MASKNKNDSELQGLSRLVTDASLGIIDLVESMHNRIVHPPLLPSTPIQNWITSIAGVAYKNIRWSTKFIGKGADKTLGMLAKVIGDIEVTEQREALRSVLNGVIGDYLEKTENPLKIDMHFRQQATPIVLNNQSIQNNYPECNGKLLLMIHGSCLNDIQWTKKEHNHGRALATALKKTPVFLNYNSGLHVSTNGQNLSDLIEQLLHIWPVPVEELTILAHSMGGLVARSAVYYGKETKQSWISSLHKMIFLGTPHHGASLEKAGNYFEAILRAIPYTKPFAKLAKIRSAGVTDLRYGNVLDEDWKDIDQHKIKGDNRNPIPLPENVACYAIAATTAKAKKSGSTKMMSDTLVTVKSALGKHRSKKKTLHFKEENTKVIYEINHTELLSNPTVYEQLISWMTD